MFKIYIDSSDRYKKSVTLFEENKEIAKEEGDLDLVVAIRDLLKENKIDIKDVEFEANPGPGSFTGLKIGVAVVNTLNWVLGKKSIKELQIPEYGAEPNIFPTKWLEKK